MDSFFTKLRQQVSFHQINSDSEDDSGTPATTSSQDIEVDEFLLIETTESLTIACDSDASCLPQRYRDPPPTYRQVSQADELPSYQSVLSGLCTIVSEPTMFSEVELSPLKCHENFYSYNQRSTLSDIPFRLHSALELQQHAVTIFNNLNLEHDSFDWSKYSHDFESERLCLRELNSDEIADIDEFVIPPSGQQSWDLLPSLDSEINLIQF